VTSGPRALLAVCVALGAAGPEVAARSAERLAAGNVLPQVAVTVPDGAPYVIEAGPPLQHVVFFATWCRPCLEEMTDLGELEARWRDRGYRLILVAVPRRQSLPRLARFAARERPPGVLLFDSDGSLQRAFGVTRIPTHVVLDASGRIVLDTGTARDLDETVIEPILSGIVRQGRQP